MRLQLNVGKSYDVLPSRFKKIIHVFVKLQRLLIISVLLLYTYLAKKGTLQYRVKCYFYNINNNRFITVKRMKRKHDNIHSSISAPALHKG